MRSIYRKAEVANARQLLSPLHQLAAAESSVNPLQAAKRPGRAPSLVDDTPSRSSGKR